MRERERERERERDCYTSLGFVHIIDFREKSTKRAIDFNIAKMLHVLLSVKCIFVVFTSIF